MVAASVGRMWAALTHSPRLTVRQRVEIQIQDLQTLSPMLEAAVVRAPGTLVASITTLVTWE